MNKEQLREIQRLLVVVDMVKGFVNVGPMADPTINIITPEILNMVNEFINNNEVVAFIKDNHEKDALEFKKFPPHCVIGTDEADLIDELLPFEKNGLVYPKNSTSTMYAPNFVQDLEAMKNLREVIVTGCCTDICIMNLVIPLINYFDQMNRGVNVIVPKNAVETYDAPFHDRNQWNEMAFKFMEQAGAEIPKQYRIGGK